MDPFELPFGESLTLWCGSQQHGAPIGRGAAFSRDITKARFVPTVCLAVADSAEGARAAVEMMQIDSRCRNYCSSSDLPVWLFLEGWDSWSPRCQPTESVGGSGFSAGSGTVSTAVFSFTASRQSESLRLVTHTWQRDCGRKFTFNVIHVLCPFLKMKNLDWRRRCCIDSCCERD